MYETLSKAAIETASGRYLDVTNPRESDIYLPDIAHALARQARFSGHTKGEQIWSVAEHSILVLRLWLDLHSALRDGEDTALRRDAVRNINPDVIQFLTEFTDDATTKQVARHCLLHDATEAYLVDLPSPIKQYSELKAVYSQLERKLNTAIFNKYKIYTSDESYAVMKWADLTALRIEAYRFMHSQGRGWEVFDTMGFEEAIMVETNPYLLPTDRVDIDFEFLTWCYAIGVPTESE